MYSDAKPMGLEDPVESIMGHVWNDKYALIMICRTYWRIFKHSLKLRNTHQPSQELSSTLSISNDDWLYRIGCLVNHYYHVLERTLKVPCVRLYYLYFSEDLLIMATNPSSALSGTILVERCLLTLVKLIEKLCVQLLPLSWKLSRLYLMRYTCSIEIVD